VSIPDAPRGLSFAGSVGVLSLRGDTIEHAFALGQGGWSRGDDSIRAQGPQSLPLRGVEQGTLILAGAGNDALPTANRVVRLLTADGWVYPYTVLAAERQGETVRLQVAEGPGFTFDAPAERLELTAFPQRTHRGPVRVEWNTPAVR